MTRHRRAFLVFGWATLAVWFGLVAYVGLSNRWGVFAVAPALLPMLVASGLVAALGIALCLSLARGRRWDTSVVLVTTLHILIVWFAMTRR